MPGMDFRRCTDLFLGTERELSLALGVSVQELRRLRADPDAARVEVLGRLAAVLAERGRGMMRVGELLSENVSASGEEGERPRSGEDWPGNGRGA